MMTNSLASFVDPSRSEEIDNRKVRPGDRPPADSIFPLVGLIKLNDPEGVVFAVPV
jgi:hypothetical protein